MTVPILAFNEVTFKFETKPPTAPVMRNLTFSIAPGETLAVVGESGSGKSTMAYCAMRDLGATGRLINGNIEVSGVDLEVLTPGELRKLRGGPGRDGSPGPYDKPQPFCTCRSSTRRSAFLS